MTPQEAVAHLVRTDPRFEVGEATIRGVSHRVFRNAPPDLRAMLAAAPWGDGDAMVFEGARWSPAQFVSDVARMARALTGPLGVRPGDRVAVAMRNLPEFPILTLAIVSVGAAVVPLNGWWTGEEIAYALRNSGARVVFADPERHARIAPEAARLGLSLVSVRGDGGPGGYEALRAAAPDGPLPDAPLDPDSDFAVMYSSGSTGHPKGVALTHRGAISTAWCLLLGRAAAPLIDGAPPPSGRRPATLIVTPLFHVTALQANALMAVAAGAKIVLMRKWDAAEAVRLVRAEAITRFVGVPTQSAELMEAARAAGDPLETLEAIIAGGAKRPAAQVAPLAEAFPRAAIATGWGMTETNAMGISLTGAEYLAHPDAAGRPTPPLQDVRIVDEDGAEVPPGEIGELTVKSPANMRCYINAPEATADALRDGWLHTGDLARRDASGLIFIVDRRKSIIIRGGENVSCLEVEGALHRHPDVLEACVFPIPDARLGETVGAAVRLRSGAETTAEAIAAFLADHIARFKIPERIWLRDAPLPRGATDKLDRRAAREACLAEGIGPAPLPGARPD